MHREEVSIGMKEEKVSYFGAYKIQFS